MQRYLNASKYIDYDHALVAETAKSLAAPAAGEHDLVRRCFEFVRDEIRHSWDYQLNPVTCRANIRVRPYN